MNRLLNAFKEWYSSGRPNDSEMILTIARTINSLFNTVRIDNDSYFRSFGFTDEYTFIEYFDDEFIEEKLKNGGGLKLLSSQRNDEQIRKTLYFLAEQYFNTRFMEESKRIAKSVLDEIIDKLIAKGIVEKHSEKGLRKTTRITLLKKVDSDEAANYFTTNFRNVEAKILSLERVLNVLEKREQVFFYDIVDEITRYFVRENIVMAGFDQPSDERDEEDDDNDNSEDSSDGDSYDEGGTSIQSTSRKVSPDEGEDGDDDSDVDDEYSGLNSENSGFSHSKQLDFEPVSLDATVRAVQDLKAFAELVKGDEEEISDDVQLLIDQLLKRLKPNEFNAFILTLAFGGFFSKVTPLETRKKITEIMATGNSTYYDSIAGFNKVVEKLRKDDSYGFDNNDVLAAIDQLLSVFSRNYVS